MMFYVDRLLQLGDYLNPTPYQNDNAFRKTFLQWSHSAENKFEVKSH